MTSQIDTTALSNGSHAIPARASDTAGLRSSASVTVSVANAVTPVDAALLPTIDITAPAAGAHGDRGRSFDRP